MIDDSAGDRDLISIALEDYHISIAPASSWQEAAALLSLEEFDVILLDYYLGGYTALDVLGKIRGHTKLPVVVLTGSNNRQIIRECFTAGASDVVDKGLCKEPDRIASVIRGVI